MENVFPALQNFGIIFGYCTSSRQVPCFFSFLFHCCCLVVVVNISVQCDCFVTFIRPRVPIAPRLVSVVPSLAAGGSDDNLTLRLKVFGSFLDLRFGDRCYQRLAQFC